MSKYTEFRDWLDAQDGDVRQRLYDVKHPARVGCLTVIVLVIVGAVLWAI
jgi:hypothetical protein